MPSPDGGSGSETWSRSEIHDRRHPLAGGDADREPRRPLTRAVEVLGSAAVVCCEDTRRTGRLLQHAGIRAERLAVTNAHTEFHRTDEVLELLGAGRTSRW